LLVDCRPPACLVKSTTPTPLSLPSVTHTTSYPQGFSICFPVPVQVFPGLCFFSVPFIFFSSPPPKPLLEAILFIRSEQPVRSCLCEVVRLFGPPFQIAPCQNLNASITHSATHPTPVGLTIPPPRRDLFEAVTRFPHRLSTIRLSNIAGIFCPPPPRSVCDAPLERSIYRQ